ncbi:hypothetical protein SKAU_G00361330 [Synaphobranchus kaupii]|uniref:Uncharacterized protein n=1 Tax=Synaphobranchus kaupii TaxID=118154 RepID=A0A9Q1IGX2_SYNKA|nr:hypothetical protein SKAU_G00361330 [Synaphobranchus kaupii]
MVRGVRGVAPCRGRGALLPTAGGEDEDDVLLRDQFQLGLHEGPLKQELQWQASPSQPHLPPGEVGHVQWRCPTRRERELLNPNPPAMVGHVGGAKTGLEEEEWQREGVPGRCPQVEVGWRKFPCLLDTGSQVTLFGEGYYRRWFGERPLQNPAVLEWLNLRGANGLQIPFIGYAVMDSPCHPTVDPVVKSCNTWIS